MDDEQGQRRRRRRHFPSHCKQNLLLAYDHLAEEHSPQAADEIFRKAKIPPSYLSDWRDKCPYERRLRRSRAVRYPMAQLCHERHDLRRRHGVKSNDLVNALTHLIYHLTNE